MALTRCPAQQDPGGPELTDTQVSPGGGLALVGYLIPHICQRNLPGRVVIYLVAAEFWPGGILGDFDNSAAAAAPRSVFVHLIGHILGHSGPVHLFRRRFGSPEVVHARGLVAGGFVVV